LLTREARLVESAARAVAADQNTTAAVSKGRRPTRLWSEIHLGEYIGVVDVDW
jgi:hypothetical protein